ncbi:MAG: DUF47 family protein [Bacteroidales bacterium]|nr:DUF47 family protein [Bacteroidales bacterium]
MNIDKFLQLFVVKEKRFFPLYIKSAENIVKAANLLLEQTRCEDPDSRRNYSHRVKECETAGDAITQQIISELLDAFVTPFDRDDIHDLAEIMDTLLDSIRDASKKIAIYQPQKASKKIIEIAEYLVKDAEIILDMTRHFENMRDEIDYLDGKCSEIKETEHIVDDIYESYMSNVFEFEKDAIELVKKKNILQALEDTSDVAKSVSAVIRSIVVKMG